MHKVYIIILSTIILGGCLKQKDDNVFLVDATEYDFGTLGSNDSIVKHSFTITNNSKDTCFILKVNKSCGCTSVKFPQHIAPYEKGTIDVMMNTKGYTGHLIRDLSIYTSLSNSPINLTLSAYIPMPIEAMRLKYHNKLFADIATNTSFLNIGNVFQDSHAYGFFEIINFSEKEEVIDFRLSSNTAAICSENRLEPLKPIKVYVLYDNNFKHWGIDTLTIDIISKGNKSSIRSVAKFIPFPTFQKKKGSPRAYIPSKKITSKCNSVRKFKIHNIGAGELKIIDYRSSNNINIKHVDTIISSSNIGNIEFSISKGKGYIYILTNDPYSPIYNFYIEAQ